MSEATIPSQFEEDASVRRTNLFFHPFSLVMSLVFPVRETKDKLLPTWKRQDFTNMQAVHLRAPDGKIVFAPHTLQFDIRCNEEISIVKQHKKLKVYMLFTSCLNFCNNNLLFL